MCDCECVGVSAALGLGTVGQCLRHSTGMCEIVHALLCVAVNVTPWLLWPAPHPLSFCLIFWPLHTAGSNPQGQVQTTEETNQEAVGVCVHATLLGQQSGPESPCNPRFFPTLIPDVHSSPGCALKSTTLSQGSFPSVSALPSARARVGFSQDPWRWGRWPVSPYRDPSTRPSHPSCTCFDPEHGLGVPASLSPGHQKGVAVCAQSAP